MKVRFALLVVLIVCLGLGGVVQANVVLSFGIHQSGLPSSGVVQELALDFERETGIKIDFQIVPDAQWRDLLRARLAAGEAPDIFGADADQFSLYERVRPDANAIDLSGEEFVSRMDPLVLPAISYDDKVYGITFPGFKVWYYFYNKEIFADLNLNPPTSYEEFKAVSKTVLDAGITPLYGALQNGWHQVLPLFEIGAHYGAQVPGLYEKLNRNEMDIRELDQLLEVIKQQKEFADLGYFGQDYVTNSVEGDMQAFANGEVAMVLQGMGWANELYIDFPEMEGNVGFFVMPWGDNQIIGVNPASNAYFGNRHSAHTEEILQFFHFLARPDNLQKRLDNDPGALQLCWPEIEPKMPPEYNAYFESQGTGTVMQAGVKFVDSQWMDVGRDLEAMFVGLITPEQVLENIAQRREQQGKLQQDPAWVD